MLFHKQDAPAHLAHIIRQYWIVENPDPTPFRQKVVPDGYGEIIVHYGDPYRIQLYEAWETQALLLLSGQIRKYFFLENTGASAMLGIKLMPSALHSLFSIDMSLLTDKVVPLHTVTANTPPMALSEAKRSPEERIQIAETWIENLLSEKPPVDSSRVDQITKLIIEKKGMVDIETLAGSQGISRRHLEREFKKYIGLTPKYFARIVQFNYIFEAMQAQDNRWVDVALNSGYFDQSHFIKNFKAFTGEAPSQYGFDEKNLANFFLKR